MTKQLTYPIKRIKTWPKEMHSEAGSALLAIEEEHYGVGELSAEEIAALELPPRWDCL